MTAAVGPYSTVRRQGNTMPQLAFSPQDSISVDSEKDTQNTIGATTVAA